MEALYTNRSTRNLYLLILLYCLLILWILRIWLKVGLLLLHCLVGAGLEVAHISACETIYQACTVRQLANALQLSPAACSMWRSRRVSASCVNSSSNISFFTLLLAWNSFVRRWHRAPCRLTSLCFHSSVKNLIRDVLFEDPHRIPPLLHS